MHLAAHESTSHRYARCIEVSKRIRWDIDSDVIRGRSFDFNQKFLPDGLSKVDRLPFLSPGERLFLSQVQGRTYANMFRLVERYIGAKMLEVGRDHALGDQVAMEAIVRLTDEELKHQELFRRIEILAAEGMPGGYRFVLDANDVAAFVLNKSSWAILALTCDIEIFSQVHYRQSIESDDSLLDAGKDILPAVCIQQARANKVSRGSRKRSSHVPAEIFRVSLSLQLEQAIYRRHFRLYLRMSLCITGKRSRSTRSWTSLNGSVRTRSWTTRHVTRLWTRGGFIR